MNRKKTIFTLMIFLIVAGMINAQNMNTEVPKISDFPVGNENTGYAQYFSGKSWLAPLTFNNELNVPMNNVTFEPGCHNNWHLHTGGQILIAVGGEGYYQERGKAAIKMMPGDVIEIAPNIEHWHGAAPDSWFSHIAIACNPHTNENLWLEPVTDEEYTQAIKRDRGSATVFSQPATNQKSEKEMDRIKLCMENYRKLFKGEALNGQGADPEMMDILQKYIFGEIFRTGDLDIKTRELITCVSLATMQQLPQLKGHVGATLNVGATPIEIREAIYQCAPLIGFPKVLNALGAMNEAFMERGIELPLEKQSTVTEEDRNEKGHAIQELLYGDNMKNIPEHLPGGLGENVECYLTEVHFGDFYTRSGLDLQMRELLTYCVLTVIGAEDQLQGHIPANIKAGNSKERLTEAVIQTMPYIGFPTAFKALKIIKETELDSESI